MLIRILDPPCIEMDADQEIFIISLISKVQIRVLSGFGSGSRRPKSCEYSTDSNSHYIFLNGIVEMSYFMKVEGWRGFCLHFWFKSSNFQAAHLIKDFFSKKKILRRSFLRIVFNFNYYKIGHLNYNFVFSFLHDQEGGWLVG